MISLRYTPEPTHQLSSTGRTYPIFSSSRFPLSGFGQTKTMYPPPERAVAASARMFYIPNVSRRSIRLVPTLSGRWGWARSVPL